MRTIRICLKYRVTGLAAEAGFFALLSFPPLVLGLVGGMGYLGSALGPDAVQRASNQLSESALKVFSVDTVASTITPTIADVLQRGRLDVISVAFLLSLWSGSRVLNVFIDTISIMYGQGGKRGIVRTRFLSFSLYAVVVLCGVIAVPLVLLGPSLLTDLLPPRIDFLIALYWPVVSLVVCACVASLYHIATPSRTSWRRDVPGSIFALLCWIEASSVLRQVIGASTSGASIYGPLAAAITVLIWLYFLALAVLIGAALNAASHQMWPVRGTSKSPLARWNHRTKRIKIPRLTRG